MYSEEELAQVRESLPEYLASVHGITDLNRNFRCLNPEHDDRNPSMSYYAPGHMCICHTTSCGAHADIFKVYGWDAGTDSFTEQIEGAAAAVGIRLSKNGKRERPLFRPKPAKKEQPAYESRDFSTLEQWRRNRITEAVTKAAFDLFDDPRAAQALDALHARGFKDGEIVRNGLGWVGSMADVEPDLFSSYWRADGGFIVLPFWDEWWFQVRYCVFRPVGPNNCHKEMKPSSEKTGVTAQLWNSQLLASGRDVYVVEGIFDAMALQVLGGVDAMAICSTSNLKILAHEIEAIEPMQRARLSLVMDNDDEGRAANEKAVALLGPTGAKFRIVDDLVPERFKDANDWLKAVRGCA